MPKNDLNDILLHQKKDKKDGSNVLLAVATVLIVFFLGIIGYKMVSQTSNNKRNSLPVQNSIGAKSDGYSSVNLEKDNTILPQQMEKTDKKEEISLDEKISQIKKNFEKDVKEKKEAKKTQVKPQNIPKQTFTISAPKPKNITSQKETNTKKTPQEIKKAKPKQKGKIKDKFYIQIASFAKSPNKQITDNIAKSGYKYTLRTVEIDGKKYLRLYVGPYATKEEAVKILPILSKNLGLDSAFVKKDY